MNKKLRQSRKGVSTVISTILMIIVVMAGMSILFGAIVVYSGNYHTGSGSAVLEAITVEDAHFTTSTNVMLSLFNTGKVEFTIANVYINNQMATIPPTPLTIQQGEHKVLSVTPPSGISFSSGTGTGYIFKIVTTRGTTFEGTYIW